MLYYLLFLVAWLSIAWTIVLGIKASRDPAKDSNGKPGAGHTPKVVRR